MFLLFFQLLCVVGLTFVTHCHSAPTANSFVFQNKRSLDNPSSVFEGLAGNLNGFSTSLDFNYGQDFPSTYNTAAGLPQSTTSFGFTGIPSSDFSTGLSQGLLSGFTASPNAQFPATPAFGLNVGYPFSTPVQLNTFGTVLSPNSIITPQLANSVSTDGQNVPISSVPNTQILSNGAVPQSIQFGASQSVPNANIRGSKALDVLPQQYPVGEEEQQVPRLQQPVVGTKSVSASVADTNQKQPNFMISPPNLPSSYDNDGINTTPLPLRFVSSDVESIPSLSLTLTPPPYAATPSHDNSKTQNSNNLYNGFNQISGVSSLDQISINSQNGQENALKANSNVLPGRPFMYNSPISVATNSAPNSIPSSNFDSNSNYYTNTNSQPSPINVNTYSTSIPASGILTNNQPNSNAVSNNFFRQSDLPSLQTYTSSVSTTNGISNNAQNANGFSDNLSPQSNPSSLQTYNPFISTNNGVSNNVPNSNIVSNNFLPQIKPNSVQTYNPSISTTSDFSNNAPNSIPSVSSNSFYRPSDSVSNPSISSNIEPNSNFGISNIIPNNLNLQSNTANKNYNSPSVTISGNTASNSFSNTNNNIPVNSIPNYSFRDVNLDSGVTPSVNSNSISASSYSDANTIQNNFNDLSSYLSKSLQ